MSASKMMTVVTDAKGKFVAAVQSDTLMSKTGEVEARVSFAPGHKLHQVDMDEELWKLRDADEFQKRVMRYVP